MNGRIYDPKLGRFLQADPFVQDAKNSQSLNRYTYVYNNPLSYTDPSGYFVSGFLRGLFRSVGGSSFLRIVTSAVACFYGGPIGCGSATAAFSYGDGNSLFRSLKNGLIAGVSAQAMQNIGGAPVLNPGEKVLFAGAVGGASAELTGGNFGHGFLSAGIGFAVGLRTGGDPSPGKFVMATIAGGTISEITGGKYANGAISAAMGYAMSSASQISREPTMEDIMPMSDEEFFTHIGEPDFGTAVDWYAWEPGDPLAPWIVDLSAGIGDAILFGLGDELRALANVHGGINYESSLYRYGGYAATVGLGGSRIVYATTVRGYSVIASSGAAASNFRTSAGNIFRVGSKRPYQPNLRNYRSDAALRAAAGRTNPYVNALGATHVGANIYNLQWQDHKQ